MVEKDTRISLGRTVRDIALHYYTGLTGYGELKASQMFPNALAANDALAESALRMAEHEILHG